MAITGSISAYIGALLTKNVPINLLLIIVGLIISFESFILLKEKDNRNNKINNNKNKNNDIKIIPENNPFLDQKSIKQNNSYYNIFLQSIISFFIGILGGLVGLVLGSIRLPAMIKILKTEPKIAVGTNILISSTMGNV
jgi:uncharacterized protein